MEKLHRRSPFEIVIKKVEKPFSGKSADELDWICETFGFLEPIDRGQTAAAVFREIVKATENSRPLTSTQLAKHVKMSRGSVINHLNNLLRSGLIVRHGRFYFARSRSMLRTIRELEEDIMRIFREMEETARQIDEEFGLRLNE